MPGTDTSRYTAHTIASWPRIAGVATVPIEPMSAHLKAEGRAGPKQHRYKKETA